MNIKQCEEKINKLEEEIQQMNKYVEFHKRLMHEKMNKKETVTGAFRASKLNKIEKEIKKDAELIELYEGELEEKVEELQKLKLLLEELTVDPTKKENVEEVGKMRKIIVKITNADYYDMVSIFVDGVPYGKKQGNSIFEIPVTSGEHSIHGIYDNMESDFEGISHALDPITFSVGNGDVNFEVKISNIYSGGKLLKI